MKKNEEGLKEEKPTVGYGGGVLPAGIKVPSPDELICYLKDIDHPEGEYVPVSKAKIYATDFGLQLGVVAHDALRTINKTKLFRYEDHVERLCNSLRYLCLDPGLATGYKANAEEVGKIWQQICNRNAHLLGEHQELEPETWITLGRTRSLPHVMYAYDYPLIPATFINPAIIELSLFANWYKTGTNVCSARSRMPTAQCIEQKVKCAARFPNYMAGMETSHLAIEGYPTFTLMLDNYGNLGELTAANIFIVSKGKVLTPRPTNILSGISRKCVIEACEGLGIQVIEQDLTIYDLINADEAFQTASSYCMFPIAGVDGKVLWKDVPGPITKRIMDKYSKGMGIEAFYEIDYKKH